MAEAGQPSLEALEATVAGLYGRLGERNATAIARRAASSRELCWPDCVNVRDLGGVPQVGGGETRYRVLVRADNIALLNPEGRRALTEYGVSTIVDLRCPGEGESVDGAVRVPLYREDGEFPAAAERCRDIRERYVLCLEWSQPLFAAAFEALASASGPALFHCTVGRDRTGLVAALALLLACAEEHAVVGDYLESRRGIRLRYEQLLAVATDGAERDALERLRVERERDLAPENVQAVIDHLAREHGGASGYLHKAGADPRALDVLRTRLAA